ncbi:MAG TPA: acetyl-CoA hydrolase/transferase C-terminal domain-containing protein [Solirubrobacterales bacterium]|nr:acetyl-CoA hydrolase/transferase C-terminal domain-containing protein [Solirubrobacterales bacterium]
MNDAPRLTPEAAVAHVRSTDSIGMPLGTGQPPALLAALGEREDWEELLVYGALLSVGTNLFNLPGVHYLSGFYGPIERMLRDSGANISFAPADFRRFAPLMEELAPRVMITAAAPPDEEGYCSLSLHAGASVEELHRAGADANRLLLVEVSANYPRTHGLMPEHPHRLHVDEIDGLIESDAAPLPLPDPEPTDTDRAIAANAAEFIPEGATLQTGIGAVPSTIASILAEGDGGDYGIHSEMFTTGLMRLHKAGKVSNRKGQFDGLSVSTFAAGTAELYEWLEGNEEVAFLPVDVINSPAYIRANRRMITINAAIGVDIHGQVVADTVGGRQYSGIGGHEDFVTGPALHLEDRSLLCLPSTVEIAGKLHSRIVPAFAAGAVITTPRHQVDVIVTEHGAAELQGKTVHQRGLELARIAHPDFRDELAAAAERASGGHSPIPAEE